MQMIKPFTINLDKEPDNSGAIVLDFSKPMDNNQPLFNSDIVEPTPKKKRGRPRKGESSISGNLFSSPAHMTGDIVTDTIDNTSDRELSIMETNEPYENKYTETNNILRSAIAQLDMEMAQLKGDIEIVRSSKTMRNKYQYLSQMQQSMGNYISNKISAARELNNTISKCNDFEMKRFKEVRAGAEADKDDDQRVMEMYKAFVNTPVSSNPFPNVSQMGVSGSPIQSAMVGNVDMMYNNYLTNMTPQQNAMHLEGNPNIQQVIVYNQETGARYFDVIDMSTGQSVPNVEKHDAMFLEDVDIDLKNKVARNVNIGETYPLVIVGQNILSEY